MLEQTLSRFFIVFALMVAPLAVGSAVARPIDGFADLAERLTPAVVNISTSQKVEQRRSRGPGQPPFDRFFEEFFNQRRGGGQAPNQKVSSLGSGFVVDPNGIIITNNHVIEEADEITVTFSDGTKLDAELSDPDAIVAVQNAEEPGAVEVVFVDELAEALGGGSPRQRLRLGARARPLSVHRVRAARASEVRAVRRVQSYGLADERALRRVREAPRRQLVAVQRRPRDADGGIADGVGGQLHALLPPRAGDARAAPVLLQPVELAVPPLDHPRPVQATNGRAEAEPAAVVAERPRRLVAQPDEQTAEQLGCVAGAPACVSEGKMLGSIY